MMRLYQKPYNKFKLRGGYSGIAGAEINQPERLNEAACLVAGTSCTVYGNKAKSALPDNVPPHPGTPAR